MKKKKITVIIFLLAFIGLFILAVQNRNPSTAIPSGKIQVSTSFYPLYFFANQIGGGKANVVNITPAGAEPHDYEPTPNDIAGIENSKLLILNGGGLEAWGNDIKKNIDNAHTLVVTAGEDLVNQSVIEEGKNVVDPHIWLSPALASSMVDKISAGFIQVDSVDKDYYQVNAEKLKIELAALDNEYRLGLANCASKDIVTSHAAFGYLATEYGLNQVPITGISPDSEPSPKTLADIGDFVKKNKVQYIFFESLVSPKLADTIAVETGAKTMVLDPIEGIIPEDVAKGVNYLSVMRSNLKNLETALQCQ